MLYGNVCSIAYNYCGCNSILNANWSRKHFNLLIFRHIAYCNACYRTGLFSQPLNYTMKWFKVNFYRIVWCIIHVCVCDVQLAFPISRNSYPWPNKMNNVHFWMLFAVYEHLPINVRWPVVEHYRKSHSFIANFICIIHHVVDKCCKRTSNFRTCQKLRSIKAMFVIFVLTKGVKS